MASYVAIRKINEDEVFATYAFGPSEERMGQMRIKKEIGEIEILEEVPGDESKFNSIRAMRKLMLHYRNNEFPDVTCFAS